MNVGLFARLHTSIFDFFNVHSNIHSCCFPCCLRLDSLDYHTFNKTYSPKNTSFLAVMADKPKEQVETAPDPDEDDLDDLDGISHTIDQTNNNSERT